MQLDFLALLIDFRLMRVTLVVFIFLNFQNCIANGNRHVEKRQALFDELINGALKLVQPIFDTGQRLQESSIIPKKSSALRETKILGAPEHSALQDVPICRGDSQICKFISCAAHNFKQDENFANLNLAAQVIGDQKLRKAISSNPEAISAVCRDQGMTPSQCKLFAQGFRIIDKFMTTIERPPNEPPDKFLNAEHPEVDEPTERRTDSMGMRDPSSGVMNDSPGYSTSKQETMQDVMMPIRPVSHFAPKKMRGSRTWSTHDYSLRDEVKPRPIVPMMTLHTAEKRAPFTMESGGIAKKVSTPHAHKPPPKTIYTSEYARISAMREKSMSIVPRPKRYAPRRLERSPDYYDELQGSETSPNDPLLNPMNDAEIKSSSGQELSYSNQNSASQASYSRMNCIQYVMDL